MPRQYLLHVWHGSVQHLDSVPVDDFSKGVSLGKASVNQVKELGTYVCVHIG